MSRRDNICSLFISLEICILLVTLLSKTCRGAHYQYEACAPTNCGFGGPNVSFPFYVPGRQESYCGYPGFELSCPAGNNLFPVLELPENKYFVQNIFYRNRSLHVYNTAAAAAADVTTSCLPAIRNTTLPQGLFDYVNFTGLRLFSGCRKPLPEELWRYNVSCGGSDWEIALYDRDEEVRDTAMERCRENVVAPVEEDGDEGIINVGDVLRKGFLLNWKASDCSTCQDSGGRCGFNESNFHFRCFCPDRPHSRSCKPRKFSI